MQVKQLLNFQLKTNHHKCHSQDLISIHTWCFNFSLSSVWAVSPGPPIPHGLHTGQCHPGHQEAVNLHWHCHTLTISKQKFNVSMRTFVCDIFVGHWQSRVLNMDRTHVAILKLKRGMNGIYAFKDIFLIILILVQVMLIQGWNQNCESVFSSSQDSSQLGVLVQTVAAVVVARSRVQHHTTNSIDPHPHRDIELTC